MLSKQAWLITLSMVAMVACNVGFPGVEDGDPLSGAGSPADDDDSSPADDDDSSPGDDDDSSPGDDDDSSPGDDDDSSPGDDDDSSPADDDDSSPGDDDDSSPAGDDDSSPAGDDDSSPAADDDDSSPGDDDDSVVNACLPDPTCSPCTSDTFEGASSLGNTCQTATWADGLAFVGDSSITICPACDQDWYERLVLVGNIYALTLSFDDSEGELQAELYDTQFPPNLLASSVSIGAGEVALAYTTTATDIYRLKVFIPPGLDYNGAAGNPYSMLIVDGAP